MRQSSLTASMRTPESVAMRLRAQSMTSAIVCGSRVARVPTASPSSGTAAGWAAVSAISFSSGKVVIGGYAVASPRADAGRETPVVLVEIQPHPETVSHRLPGVDPGRVGRAEPLSDFLRIEPVDLDVPRIVAIIYSGNDDDGDVIKRFPFRSLLQRRESEPSVLRGADRDALVPPVFLNLPDIGPAGGPAPAWARILHPPVRASPRPLVCSMVRELSIVLNWFDMIRATVHVRFDVSPNNIRQREYCRKQLSDGLAASEPNGALSPGH